MEVLQGWIIICSWMAICLPCFKCSPLAEWKSHFVNCYDNTTGVLLFLIIMCCAVPLTSATSTCDKGVITPRNPYFLLGQNITLTCSRKKHPARQLIFKRGQNKTEVDPRYIHWLNSTAIQLVIENVTALDVEMHNKRMNYLCYDRRSKGEKCLDNIFVKLDYYPVEARNVTCHVYNWDTMTCTWSLGVNYIHEDDVNVTCVYIEDTVTSELVYLRSHSDEYWENCPAQNRTACHWDIFPDSEYTVVRINVTNTVLGVSASTREIEFQRHDIVEPAPVDASSIWVTQANANDCATIKWRPVRQNRSHYCHLVMESVCTHPQDQYRMYVGTPETPSTVQVCDLTPNTVYNGTLRCRALEYDGTPAGVWSRPTMFQHRSPSTAPLINPVVRDGLFEIIGNNNKDHGSTIQVYIKPLTDCDTHSDSVYYNVSLSHAYVIVHHPSYHAELYLPASSTNQIQVFAASDYGRAEGYSMVMVHSRNQWPAVSVELVVEHNTSDVCTGTIFTHRADPTFSNMTHSLVWCKQMVSHRRVVCQDPLQWSELGQNVSSFTYPIQACTSAYMFGITTKGRNLQSAEIISTGIQWAKCLYEKGAVVKTPVNGLRQINYSAVESFYVQWDRYDCTLVRMAYVMSYLVSYCTRGGGDGKNCECAGEITRVNISNQGTSCSVDRVEPGTQVCVWVRAVTAAGMAPNNTEPLSVSVQGEDHYVTLIAICATLGAVAIAIVGICIFRKCRKKWRDITKPPDFDLPDLPTLFHETVDDETKPTDSGTSSMEDGSRGSKSSRETVDSIGEADSAVYMHIDPDIPLELLNDDTVSNYEIAEKINVRTEIDDTYNDPPGISSYCEAVPDISSGLSSNSQGQYDDCLGSNNFQTPNVHSESLSEHSSSDSLRATCPSDRLHSLTDQAKERNKCPVTVTKTDTIPPTQGVTGIPVSSQAGTSNVVPVLAHGRVNLDGYSVTFELELELDSESEDDSFEEIDHLLKNHEPVIDIDCSVAPEVPVCNTGSTISKTTENPYVSYGDKQVQSTLSLLCAADDVDTTADCVCGIDVSSDQTKESTDTLPLILSLPAVT